MAAAASPAEVLAFGEYELDERRFELRRAGEVVRLEPKAFDLLRLLVRRRERVVTKEELLDELWPGASSDAVVARYVADARKAVGDHSTAQRVIKTVHGRGYRFVAEIAVANPVAAQCSDPFVGREDALSALEASLRDALGGRSRVVMLVGEPGIGKTRTAAELVSRARTKGATTVEGRCHEGEGAPALWPWVQVLRATAGHLGMDRTRALVGRRAADLAALLPELGAATADALAELSPDQARFRQFDAVVELFRGVSREQTLVVVLDDLHWADESSLLLVRFLARELRDARVLVVGTYRDVEIGRHHPLAEILGDLAREPAFARIALRGLTEADVRAYFELLDGGGVSEELAAAVHARTDGNPFFLGEVARLLAGARTAGGHPGAPAGLPEGVREAIGRRLDGLSRDANEVLAVASVVGRSFPVSIVERAADLAPERVLAALDEAVAARVLVKDDEFRLSFVHALVREALYDELSIVQKVRHHRRVAELLEATHAADPGPHLAEIAHHHFQAAPSARDARAVESCERAARRALELLSYEEAARHYARALEASDFVEPDDPARRTRLWLGRGDALASAGDRDAAREAFTRAATLARNSHRPDLLARAALGLGGPFDYFGTPLDPVLGALLEEARSSLDSRHHPGLAAGVLGRLASTPPYSESLRSRDELSREAVALARADGEPPMLSRALGARFWALLGPDHVHERLALGDELLALAKATEDPNYAVLGHEYRVGSLVAVGDVGAAEREVDALARHAEALRRPVDRWLVLWFRGSLAIGAGRFSEAEDLVEEARRCGERAQHPGAPVVYAGQSAWLANQRGHAEALAAGLTAFEADYAWAARVGRIVVAFAHAESGDREAAAELLGTIGGDGLRMIPRDEHWLWSCCLLAATAAAVGDGPRAETLQDLLRPFADRLAVHDLLRIHAGSVSLYLGMLASTLGDAEGAETHLRAALAAHRRAGALPYVARTQLELGRLLLATNAGKARKALREAETLATRLGAERIARAARAAAG